MDPVVGRAIHLALGWLLLASAGHKLRDVPRFVRIVHDYGLLPRRTVPAGAALLIALEVAIGAALLLPAAAAPASLATAALLSLYGFAIAVNVARGRRDIDCGCGGPADRPLSGALLWRNGALAGVAIAGAVPTLDRAWTALDVVTCAFAVCACVLLGSAAGRLAAFPLPWLPVRRRTET